MGPFWCVSVGVGRGKGELEEEGPVYHILRRMLIGWK